MTTLMLVESPDGRQMCVPFVINALKVENVKRGYRKTRVARCRSLSAQGSRARDL